MSSPVLIASPVLEGKEEKANEAKKDATEEKREANYKAAKERCDSLAGNAKDTCEKDAKAKFRM